MTTASSATVDRPPPVAPERRCGAIRALFDQRLRPLWVVAVSVLAVFTAFRAGLLLLSADFIRNEGILAVLRCFAVGFRYDMVPLGYMLLPLMLVLSLVKNARLSGRRFRQVVTAYAAAILTLVVAVEVVGSAFFASFYHRLNWVAVNYPRHPKEIVTNIWMSYPLWLFVPGTCVFAYLAYRLGLRFFWRGAAGDQSILSRAVRAIVLVGLGVLACRGGLDNRPLCSGSASFSSNNVIRQLTLNNIYTLCRATRSTLTDGRNEMLDYPLPKLTEAQEVVERMLHQDVEEPVGGGAGPLWRRRVTGREMLDHNVVVIVMESMSGPPVGAMGYSPTSTPNLDALCSEGLFFERMYAVGSRTSRGMMGVLCGHPDLVGISVLERRRAQGKFLTLPAIFKGRGYETLLVYGGDCDFDNMREFFSAGGVTTFIDQKDMAGGSVRPGCWGLPDEVVLAKADETFRSMGSRKFFAVILTVSNHRPYDIPTGRVAMLEGDTEDKRRINAYRYADWALGEFFRKARGQPYFDDTIFVLVADHGHVLSPVYGIDVPGFRIPCVFYAPGLIRPGRLKTTCSQTDIAPTLLGILGGTYEHCFLGRDVLRVPEDDGFALVHHDDYLGFIRSDRALVLPPEPADADAMPSEPISVLFRVGPFGMTPISPPKTDQSQAESFRLRMLSYYKMARHLYLKGAYGPDPGPPMAAAGP